jgi:hypothetical protein
VSDFFEVPAPAAAPPDFKMYPWAGPPDNELGVTVPLQIALARTDAIALTIPSAFVYSSGFVLSLALRRRKPQRDPLGNPPTALSFQSQTEGDLRFGLEFSDGTKATTARRLPMGSSPSPPLLTTRGSHGSARRTDGELWAWPLPPAGPLAFVWDWRTEGISLTRHEADAKPILDAAARIEQLWPDDRPLPTGPWTHVGG